MLSLRMGIDHFRANRKRCSVVNIITCRFKKMTHAKKNTISTLLDYPMVIQVGVHLLLK